MGTGGRHDVSDGVVDSAAAEAPSALPPAPSSPPGDADTAGLARGWRRFANGSRLALLRRGLTGQLLTFAAMVAPVLMRAGEQVFVLVLTSALAIALLSPALLGYQFLYPVLRGPRTARVATATALCGLTAVSVLLLAGTWYEPAADLPRGTFAAASVLLFTQGLYTVAVTQLVRTDDSAGIGLARLVYGSALLVASLAASALDVTPLGLTLAAALSYAIAYCVLRARTASAALERVGLSASGRRRLARAYVRRSVRPTVSSLANGWAFFLPGISLPGLGAAAQPWAIVTRICGGFATVLLTLMAPPLEARMSTAVRNRDRAGFASARRLALVLGMATSVAAMVTGLALALYAVPDPEAWFVPVLTATLAFWGVLLASGLINRLPNFVGRDSERLVWDAARAGLVTAAYLTTDGVTRLVVMGAVLTVFGLLLLPLSRWRSTAVAA